MPQALSVSNSLQNGFDQFFGFIPNVIGFLIILLIGYVIAKIIKKAVTVAVQKVGIDERLDATPAGGFVDGISPGGKPSKLIGTIVYYFIFLYALVAALGALKIPSVTTFLNQVLAYLPNVVVAVLIFVIAAAISGGIVAVIQRTMGDTPTGKLAETILPGVILAIAGFMILTQLKIAPQIVLITYGAIVGMLALAGALAFGLGGRDVAAQIWQSAYDNAGQAKQQAQVDVQVAKTRAPRARKQI